MGLTLGSLLLLLRSSHVFFALSISIVSLLIIRVYLKELNILKANSITDVIYYILGNQSKVFSRQEVKYV